MKNALLLIGEDLSINQAFTQYILNFYKAHFKELGQLHFINKGDKELPFLIENLCSSFKTLCIFASSESYAITAKILATLSGDTLELKEPNTLALSKALKVCENSFLINLNDCRINLMKASPAHKLPVIHIEPNLNFEYFHLCFIDDESAKILLEPLAKTYDVQVNISLVTQNLVIVRAQASKFGKLGGFMDAAQNLFAQKFIPSGDTVEFIARRLKQNGLKITFAESCTAGLAAAKFGAFSGVSAAFDGALVTYSNEIKSEWLGVDKNLLQNYGAVSEQCVEAMLKGALRASGADFALAISGIAGPDGGSEQKPVGTVFVGAASKDGASLIERLNLSGDRNYIREQSALHAYICLLRLSPELFFA